MTDWVTSDLHFGHANSMKFCPHSRGKWTTVEEMNEGIIEEWNNCVSVDDTVYIIGDVSFMSITETIEILNRLNGRKILIKGNHDQKYVKNTKFRECFAAIHADFMGTIGGTYIHMYHFPLSEWNSCHRGSVHLHGHLHGKPSGLEHYRVRDVGFDKTCKVVSKLSDIITDALTGEIKTHH